MQQVGLGTQATFYARFQAADGSVIVPDEPLVDVLRPDATLFLADQVPTAAGEGAAGQYTFTFDMPIDEVEGEWTITWNGTYLGTALAENEPFEVVPAAQITLVSGIIMRLRRLIGERIPIGKTEDDTRFTDAEISAVYRDNNNDLNKTLAELWLAKAAYLGDFVDINESGTIRSLSQMNRAAMAQATKYEAIVQGYENAWQATYRALPRTFSPWTDDRPGLIQRGAVIIYSDPQRAWTA